MAQLSPYDYGSIPYLGTDVYSAEEDLLKLAAKYFYDGENVELSTLRPSVFGMFSQAAALIMKNGMFHRNALYDEFFLNSASFDSSIYNFASELNYTIGLATPAKVTLAFGLKEADLIANSDIIGGDTGNRVFKIDKFSLIYMDKFQYMLPNSVIIQCKKLGTTTNGSSWQFTANYQLSEWHLKDYSITNPYIKLYRSSSNGESYVIIELVAYQMSYRETTAEIYESDINIRLSWILQFENQLAGFKTLMRRPTENDYEIISTAVFNSSEAPSAGTTYYYYDYPSSSEVEIYFGEVPDYRPPYGSGMRFFTYSTLGSAGNFSYNGAVSFRLVTSDEDIALGYTDKSGVKVYCKNISDSTGGSDRPSALEIKDALIKSKLIRNNLITDYDLDVFFNSQIVKDVVNGGEITFFKHRDDVIRRMFSAFSLLRDNYRRVVPTNTVSFIVDYERLEGMKNSIKPGTIVIYDSVARVYRILEEEEYPEAYINDPRNFIYAIPYLLAFKIDPFPRMIYYSVDVDLDQPMYMKEDPVFSWEVLINNLQIKRGSVYDNEYYISLNLNHNINSFVTPIEATGEASDYLKVRLLFKSDVSDEYYFCVDLERELGSENTYSAYLHTEDEIDSDGSIVLYSVAGTHNLVNLSGEQITQVSVPEKFKIEAVVLYDALGCEGAGVSSEIASESITLHPMFQSMIDLSGSLSTGASYQYGIAAIFGQGEDDFFYFHRNKSNFMYSDALINSNASIVFHNIPVIGLKYFSDRDNYKEVNRVLRVYETLLDQNKSRLENNTMISFKFYNSYGVSRCYQVDSTNLFIEMKIKLNVNKTQELDARIRAAIVSYVEQSNAKNVVDFSSIITLLRNTFPEILLINIVGLNSLGIQSIERFPTKNPENMTVDELRNYVPEYLNVNLEENLGRLTYSIKLTYI